MRRVSTLLAVSITSILLLAGCGVASPAPPAPQAARPQAAAAAPAAAAPAAPAPAAAPAAESQQPPALVPVRAGLLPSILTAPIYAGADLGIWRQNGLDVSIEPFTTTADIMTLLAAGRLELGAVTMGSAVFNAYNRGVDLIVAGAGPLAVTPVVVRKDLWDSGQVRSARDLKGARYALNGRGTIIEYTQFKVLERGGLTPADVEVPILPWPDQITALANRAIDVGMMGEPLASLAVARGAGVILEEQSSGQPWYAPGLQGSMMMFNRQWAEANPALTTAIVKSYLQTARRIQGTKLFDDAEALASVERWVNVTPEVVRSGTPPLWALNGRVHVESMMDAQRYFVETGGTDYRQPIPPERLITERYLNEALAEIGLVPEP